MKLNKSRTAWRAGVSDWRLLPPGVYEVGLIRRLIGPSDKIHPSLGYSPLWVDEMTFDERNHLYKVYESEGLYVMQSEALRYDTSVWKTRAIAWHTALQEESE